MALQHDLIRSPDRRYILQYAVLTLVIFLPLVWAFVRVRNTYPIATWNVMMAGGELQRGRTYFILRGETVGGERIEIRAAGLTNALYGRNWGMVAATVNNESFKLPTLHPDNARLLWQVNGIENLPPGARIPDLLQAWGQLYNDRQSADSPRRLRAIELDMYRWEGGSYSGFDKFLDSWRKEL